MSGKAAVSRAMWLSVLGTDVQHQAPNPQDHAWQMWLSALGTDVQHQAPNPQDR